MSLAQLQQRLQDIYELDLAHNINNYLITDWDVAASLESSAPCKNRKEKLLVYQYKEELHLSLYLHDGIIKTLHDDDPALHLHNGNLSDFCLALEGISHFLYLVWNASYDRSVTMLEMELQAEIDKFIMLVSYLEEQFKRPAPGQLRRLLFESIHFHGELSAREFQRYRDANNLAEKYCWYLESRSYFRNGNERVLLGELRRFYRLNLDDKLRRINYLH
ncbi:MAG: hypothetical protein ACE5GZ_01510 [Gammaproteobacteria bacterium]